MSTTLDTAITADEMTVPIAKRLLPINLADLELNGRELKFVAAYCTNGFNSAMAARQAGYVAKRKEFQGSYGSEMTSRPHVAEAIRRFIDSIINPFKDKLQYELLDVYYRRATYDVETFYRVDEAGNATLAPLSQIPKEWRVCIDGVETKVSGGMNPMRWTEYKLPNRDTALGILMKMISLTEDPNANQMLPEEAREHAKQIFAKVLSDQKVVHSLQALARPSKPKIAKPTEE